MTLLKINSQPTYCASPWDWETGLVSGYTQWTGYTVTYVSAEFTQTIAIFSDNESYQKVFGAQTLHRDFLIDTCDGYYLLHYFLVTQQNEICRTMK